MIIDETTVVSMNLWKWIVSIYLCEYKRETSRPSVVNYNLYLPAGETWLMLCEQWYFLILASFWWSLPYCGEPRTATFIFISSKPTYVLPMYRHLEVWKHDNGSDDKIKQSETVLSLETEYHTVNSLFCESTILRFHCFCINLQEYKMASTNDLF